MASNARMRTLANRMIPKETRGRGTDRVFYEWWMLCEAESHLLDPLLDFPTRNAWIESGVLHARSLSDFFYGDLFRVRRKAGDVFAEVLLSPNEWHAARPLVSPMLSRPEFRDPANSQIMHVAVSNEPKKSWDFVAMASALQPALECFLNLVPLEALGGYWDNQLQERAGARWDGVQRALVMRRRG